jgi:serine/threonine protein kinase
MPDQPVPPESPSDPPAGADATRIFKRDEAPSASGLGEPTTASPAGMEAQPAAPATIEPGQVLGHTYEIEALLARGGMGAVYRARHTELGSIHAIKIILPELVSDARVVSMFKEEAKKLRRLRHEAIVAYEGLFRDEFGRRYLVMEFVEGVPLATLLKQRPLTPPEVRELRDRIAAGLGAAHDKGIYHRDISPDNIILVEGNISSAKIIDFGIAKSADPGDRTVIGSDFAGKYSYVSPEQLGAYGGTVDGRSDIYSLGLVLVAAAQGRPLDMGNTPIAVVEKRQKVPDLAGVPEELRDEIRPLLEPDPARRPQSMRELPSRAVLASVAPTMAPAAAATEPEPLWPVAPTAAPAAVAETAPPPPARKRSMLPLVAAALASFAIVIAGGYFFLLRPTGDTAPPVPAAPPAQTAAVTPPPTPIAPPATPTPPAASTAAATPPPVETPTLASPTATLQSTAPVPVIPPPTPAPPAPAPPVPAAAAPAPAPTATAETPVAPPATPPPAQTATLAIAPPQRSEIEARLDSLAQRFQCAHLETHIGDDFAWVSGFVGRQDDLDALRGDIRGISGIKQISENVAVYAWPHCAYVKLTLEAASEASAHEAPRLDFNKPSKIYRNGDKLVVKATIGKAHDGYLYVDYIDNGGTVVHIFPTPLRKNNLVKAGQQVTLGTASANAREDERVYEISEPFGPNLVIAIFSPKPLFEKLGEEAEPADQYLRALQAKLTSLAGTSAGKELASSYSFIDTRP